MDTPDRPRAGDAAGFEDSPVFNFINNLSPIPVPKPLDSAHNVQLFKSSDLAHVSSIFASPHVNPAKEPKFLIRDDSVQVAQESNSPNSVRTRIGSSSTFRLIRCSNIVSENCNITCHLNEASNVSSDNTQNGVGSVESDKNQCADGETDLTVSQECTDLEGIILDQSGPNKMDPSHSGKGVHENQLSEQNKDGLTAFNGDYMITHQPSVMLTLAVPFEAETLSLNDTLKTDNAYSCKSLLNDKSSGYYIQNSVHEPHLYWVGAVDGATVDYTPQMLPDALQSQLMPNDQICNKLNQPSDYMPTEQNALSQHLRGMRRRSLFNEKAGATNVNKASDHHFASSSTPKCKIISGDNNSKPLRTPPCALPGIGLHLNALATLSKGKIAPQDTQSTLNQSSILPCPAGSSPPPSEQNIINDDFSQTTNVASAEDPSQGSPKKKRHKFDNGDDTSCKRCSCKKSKCLKLYCECFAAGVYCSEPCSCQGCLNTHSHMETVLSTRQQIESRNPLAFAPKVTHTSDPDQELGDYTNKTPASARHKRGCNCKKSSCTKKYCECFQGGAGCSMSCRCEGCKNGFGRREGVAVLSIEEAKWPLEEKNACVKEEKCENDKYLVIYQATDPAPAENVLATPLIVDCRPLVALPPPSSKKPQPRSSTKVTGHSSRLCNSQAPLKSDILLSPFKNYAEMFLGDSTPETLNGNSSPQTSVKVVSPNKKRISPPRIGTGLSPICKSGRKFILKSIPSFPSLGGDINSEDPKSKSPAP
ncbi:protein tesmin/TSO1-like CXC 2 [Phragmites australis]|uniref:protein tesmin/TSO1-like CXC 2 n=1 Tax=Phragmites australis TaxID=29695 RepID=UPI002D776E77|nr:protein tesmin/TSO1-like CXC 2 [Phragmites australis]XP_062202157.1 protein tesmin/TSO1-like CXC 2 [Phragmites australis]